MYLLTYLLAEGGAVITFVAHWPLSYYTNRDMDEWYEIKCKMEAENRKGRKIREEMHFRKSEELKERQREDLNAESLQTNPSMGDSRRRWNPLYGITTSKKNDLL